MTEAFTLMGGCLVGGLIGALVSIGVQCLLKHKPKGK
jgi:hypothetical protein